MTWQLPRGSLYVTLPLVLAGMVYYLAIFRPQQAATARVRIELAALGQSAGEAQQSGARLVPLTEESRELDAYLAEWEPRLARVDDLSDVWGRIGELADAAGVVTTRLAPGTPTTTGSLQRVPLELDVEGDFGRLGDFLARLEESKQAIWIEQLKLHRPGEPGSPLRCELKLVVFAG